MTDIQKALRLLESYKKELDKAGGSNDKATSMFLESTIRRLREGYYDERLTLLQDHMTRLGFRKFNKSSPITKTIREYKKFDF